MKQWLAADSRLMLFLSKILDVAVAGIWFLLCCIPVITIGPALTAMYYAVEKSICRSEGYLTREYFRCFRQNFRQALAVWGILLGILLLMSFNILMLTGMNLGVAGIALSAVYYAVIFVVLIVVSYCFPVLSRFECTVKGLFQTVVQMAVSHLKDTIVFLILQLFFAGGMIFGFWYLPLLVFFLPGVVMILQSKIMERVMGEYLPENQEVEEEADRML